MQMLYNSDAYAVVCFEFGTDAETPSAADDASNGPPQRGGFEIVDKRLRREIFLSGAMAKSFQQGAQTLSETDPTPEQWDDYIAGFTELAAQPLVMH